MATAKTAKVPLEVNQPLTGKVKYIAYYPEKPSTRQEGKVDAAQWGLTGTWTWIDAEEMKQQAEGRVYVTEYMLQNSPLQLGLAVADGQWDDGNPKYKWVYPEAVRISMRKETGGKRLQVTITRLTELPTATGAAPTPPVASTGRAQPTATRSTTSVAPVAVPPDAGWDGLARNYLKAVTVASTTWASVWPDGVEPMPSEALVAAAATVFIEANKRGLSVPPAHVPLTQGQREQNKQAAQQQFENNPLDEDEEALPF